MLQARVQILRVFSDYDQIDVVVSCLYARKVEDRSKVRVEIERPSNVDVHARETAADRGPDRALECNAVPADRIEHGLRQGGSLPLEYINPGVVPLPLDVDSAPRQHEQYRLGYFWADTVALDQCDAVGHGCSRWGRENTAL